MKAFPNGMITDDRGVIVSSQLGMDLRDYFAAKAMAALMSHETFINAVSAQRVPPSALVKQAYMFADLMMEARNESL
jgi:hypothetical protein